MPKEYRIPIESFEASGIVPEVGANITLKLSNKMVVKGTITKVENDFATITPTIET